MNDKIIGVKLYGHDSGVFIIDPKKKRLYGLDTERLTRIKHDASSIMPILKKLNLVNQQVYLINSFRHQMYNYGSFLIRDNRHEILKFLDINFIKDLTKRYSSLSNLKRSQILIRRDFFPGLKIVFKSFFGLILSKLIKNEELNKRLIENKIRKQILNKNLFFECKDHHLCHAASSYYFSPYKKNEKILSLTLDGFGDGYYSKLYLGKNNKLKFLAGSKLKYISINNEKRVIGIGTLYSYFTEALGLIMNSEEGKVEALACYSKNKKNKLYKELMSIFKINENLSIGFNLKKALKYFDRKFLLLKRKEFGDEDFSMAIQLFLEEFILDYVKKIIKKYKIKKFCFSGGVFANVKLNLRLFEESGLKQMYVFPAMADDGASVGAAILKTIELGYDVSWLKKVEMPYFGESYSKKEIEKELLKQKYSKFLSFKKINNWPKKIAELISKGEIVSLYNKKMEYGPRALGHRSVLANPLKKETRDLINSTIKRRPSYQPFCPSVLEQERKRLFLKSYSNKHMTCAFKLKPKMFKKLPSAGHIDGTARPQFISKKDDPDFYNVLKEFKKITGYGILINTSFNLHGRTIVMTPKDAIDDFLACGLKYMFMPPYIIKIKNDEKDFNIGKISQD